MPQEAPDAREVVELIRKAGRRAVPLAYLTTGAAIINTSSVNACEPSERLIDFAATDAAIANVPKDLAKALAPTGIRVHAVAPGPFWTPLQVSGGKLPGTLPCFGAETPIGRPGQPAELAGSSVLLASNEASEATGQVFGAVGVRGGP